MPTSDLTNSAKQAPLGQQDADQSLPRQPLLGAEPTLAHSLPSLQIAVVLLSTALLISGLYFGRDIFIPLSLALLLAFVLDPLVVALKRRGLPRSASVILVVFAAIAILGAAGALLGGQLRALSVELPTYQKNIQQKLRDLRERFQAPGALDGVIQTIDGVQSEVESLSAATPAQRPAASPPQRVQIEDKPASPFRQAMTVLGAAGGPLVDAGIVLVFLVLMLLDRQDLRDRLLRLLGGNMHRTTDALDEAGVRISKYLTMQLVVNLSYGVPMAAGLWLIGVPGAILWGTVAAVMRFLPYLGPMVSAVFPLALAFAVDPGWNMVLLTLGLILVLELVSNNVVEPWVYGTTTGLSAMSLMVAATFWTTLWGPVGLVMSTPLTVCLLVLGRHLPQLAFLDVLLGSQPALDAPTRFYQRLLAGDVDDAVELAAERVELPSAGGVSGFYHHVGVPALRLASGDHASVASAEHRHRLVSGTDRVIDELCEQFPPPQGSTPLRVMCLGGKWEADRLAARMLAHALSLSGMAAGHHAGGLSSTDSMAKLDLQGAHTVCLSFFSPQPQTSARYLCRRLRRRWPDLHIVLALWNAPPESLAEDSAKAMGADAVATSIDEAVMRVTQLLGDELSESYLPAPIPQTDVDRVRALRASGLLGEEARAHFDRAARRAADIFDVPLAMVSLIDESRQQVGGVGGGMPDLNAMRSALDMPRELSVCGHVVASGKTLVVEDLARDPRFATNPALCSRGLRFYAGAALSDDAGHILGSLCLLDTQPRVMSTRDIRLLEVMAAELVDSLNLARPSAAPPLSVPSDLPPQAFETPTAGLGQAAQG